MKSDLKTWSKDVGKVEIDIAKLFKELWDEGYDDSHLFLLSEVIDNLIKLKE